jgi:hypothetical protein
MAEDTGTVRTIVKKITLGVPIRKVTGAQAQGISDLTDVSNETAKEHDLFQYQIETEKFEKTSRPAGLRIWGGQF